MSKPNIPLAMKSELIEWGRTGGGNSAAHATMIVTKYGEMLVCLAELRKGNEIAEKTLASYTELASDIVEVTQNFLPATTASLEDMVQTFETLASHFAAIRSTLDAAGFTVTPSGAFVPAGKGVTH